MTIKKSLMGAAGVAALALAASVGPAAADGTYVESVAAPAAEEGREFSWSITVGGTSDYIFRGLSLSNEDPAAQGSIDMSYGIVYWGAWASNVSGDGYAPWELDLYAGITPSIGRLNFDFGVVGYLYPGADDSLPYVEFKAGMNTELFKNLTGGVTFWYTPDSNNYGESWTVEGTLSYALPQCGIFEPSISGLVGYSDDIDNNALFSNFTDNYTYWNAGLSVAVEKFTMDFRYWDTNLDNTPGDVYYGLADERFVFSAKVTLP
jgi:uncharacterized protein (TIGR02001 family)